MEYEIVTANSKKEEAHEVCKRASNKAEEKDEIVIMKHGGEEIQVFPESFWANILHIWYLRRNFEEKKEGDYLLFRAQLLELLRKEIDNKEE